MAMETKVVMVTPEMAKEWLKYNMKGQRNVMNKYAHRIPGIVGAAVLAAIYRGESDDALRRFCDIYRHNDVSNCDGYGVRYALNIRDYVKQYKQNSEVYNRIESSIYAFAHNLSHFRVRENCYPLNAALDQ